MTTKEVNIRSVKALAIKIYSNDSVLRGVLTREPDLLPVSDFIAKLGYVA